MCSLRLYFGPLHDILTKIWPSSRFGLPMTDLNSELAKLRNQIKYLRGEQLAGMTTEEELAGIPPYELIENVSFFFAKSIV
jgi:hypothetical protein